jgi:hypothetical protein
MGPAARANLGRVSILPGRVRIDALTADVGCGVLSAPRVDIRGGVLSALMGRGYHLDRLEARGWTLDLARGQGERESAAEGPGAPLARSLGGVLAAFNLKADVALDDISLDGDVVIPEDGAKPAVRIHVTVSGGGLGEGRDGRLVCNASAVSGDASAPVSTVTLTATLRATVEAEGTLTRAEVNADANARGRDFPSGIGLSFAGVALRADKAVTYSLSLSRGAEAVAECNARVGNGDPRVTGSWRLDLRDTDLAPFALGRSLPEFHAEGRGQYTVTVPTGAVHTTGKLAISADQLGRVERSLSPLGRVELSADFDMAGEGTSLRVERLDTTLSNGKPVLAIRALQSFEFDSATGELKVAAPSGDLVGISLRGVPVEWLQGVAPGFGFSGTPLNGEFFLRAEEGRLALRTRAPLTSTGLGVARLGRNLADGLDLSAFILADYAPQGWQVQLAPLSLKKNATKILALEARFGRLQGSGGPVKAAGSWSASLPQVLSEPWASGLPVLSAGDASGSFEAVLGATREVRVKVSLSGLESPSRPGVTLPSITSEVRADFGPNGRTAFSAPLTVDYGPRSMALQLAGSVSEGPEGPVFDGTFSAGLLLPEDLALIGALAGPQERAARTEPSPGVVPAPVASWPGWKGHIASKAEGIDVLGNHLSSLTMVLDVEPSAVVITSASAELGDGSTAKLTGRLNYFPAASESYLARADLVVTGLDSAPLLASLDPLRPPVVEGRFDLTAHLSSGGSGWEDMLKRFHGDATLTSKGGIFRALRTKVIDSQRQNASRIASALDTVGSLFGKKTDKIGTALLESVKGISEVRYDQMGVSVERGSDLDLRISELTLIAPNVRLTGKGRITHAEGVPIRDQALSLDLDLGVRGRLEQAMDIVGLLGEGQDELGYTHLYQTVHLSGSLSSIDDSQWRDTLIQAPLKKGGLFDKLLGR